MTTADYYDLQVRKWSAAAAEWNDKPPPATPSPNDLAIIDKLLTEFHPRAVAILGATPSLRVTLSRIPAIRQVYIVDMTPQMIASSLNRFPLQGNEEIIAASWLEVPLVDGALNCIVGDKSADNVAAADMRSLFLECRRLLDHRGRLILHVGLTPDDLALTFESAISESTALISRGASYRTATANLWELLLTGSGTANADNLTLAYWKEALTAWQVRDLRDDSAQAGLRHAFFMDYGDSFDATWTNVTRTLLAASSFPDFTIEGEYRASDYAVSNWQPTVVFAPTLTSGRNSGRGV